MFLISLHELHGNWRRHCLAELASIVTTFLSKPPFSFLALPSLQQVKRAED